ncbi:Cysteine desulfurase [Sulfitobacter noctilucicola]|uniref:Cysteine desulfurase n=1 Tax=Sulfitobacter noctilucicola TaxID=1342301 RepID=A0A7W6M8U1_9RHOB|nr:aminotransferase class V-fold PLP-dependent enzyme [Sulfitobacter noctilucicola]KIN65068.1 Cysteine desulfurase [Sulfitobacter noctilucicola]MBB4173792.1 cysteine desulfurase [Sulfitobacter noctilucicola]
MRAYLDHNATTPLRAEARAAMHSAMDVAGNPSSVHAEGRAAKMLIEKARVQVANLVGCLPAQVIFTSSATEAAALAVGQKAQHGGIFLALPTEHDCLGVWTDHAMASLVGRDGKISPVGGEAYLNQISSLAGQEWRDDRTDVALVAISGANSETGVMAGVTGDSFVSASRAGKVPYAVVCDITQMAGKVAIDLTKEKPSYMILSAHKMGGPKGVGAFINLTSKDPDPVLRGGGQEQNRRSGTENVIGIAGFGAAADAAAHDVASGRWSEVEELRNILELALAASTKKTIFVGNEAPRLPNTSCIIADGWKGETQVMQMDLAGFAISAGSACSSGKVKASTVLQAMGYSQSEASSAIRVSLGLETTKEDVERFAEAWLAKREKHAQRAA